MSKKAESTFDFEMPKAQETKTAQDQINYLAYEVFHKNKHGKELLAKLKEYFVNVCVLPTHPDIIKQFGCLESYMAFKSGQGNIIKWLEMCISTHREGK